MHIFHFYIFYYFLHNVKIFCASIKICKCDELILFWLKHSKNRTKDEERVCFTRRLKASLRCHSACPPTRYFGGEVNDQREEKRQKSFTKSKKDPFKRFQRNQRNRNGGLEEGPYFQQHPVFTYRQYDLQQGHLRVHTVLKFYSIQVSVDPH